MIPYDGLGADFRRSARIAALKTTLSYVRAGALVVVLAVLLLVPLAFVALEITLGALKDLWKALKTDFMVVLRMAWEELIPEETARET